MLQGAVFILTGMLAIILPVATAVGFELLIGALLLASSVTRAIASFRSRIHWWSLLSSVAAIVVGLFMLFYPTLGTLVLATILAVFLIVEGLTEALLPVQFRPARNWGWLRCN